MLPIQLLALKKSPSPIHFFKVLTLKDRQGNQDIKAYIFPNQPISPNVPLSQFEIALEKVEIMQN
ncbi:hypothetical protein PRO82_001391 [Candidatus Protochlamydia amoebophila]|uniref:hypothetical protein n=1 Tax=Candidatus Protochlamydia amoebophila TaxID=362787 RepID=UPI001BC94FB7|nr:hypothetical protein [Candidatus Protochlamydia amoebophila]MBS4164077.1 hypothetical protein [Candidatus Protochlamydia amoebophila]